MKALAPDWDNGFQSLVIAPRASPQEPWTALLGKSAPFLYKKGWEETGMTVWELVTRLRTRRLRDT